MELVFIAHLKMFYIFRWLLFRNYFFSNSDFSLQSHYHAQGSSVDSVSHLSGCFKYQKLSKKCATRSSKEREDPLGNYFPLAAEFNRSSEEQLFKVAQESGSQTRQPRRQWLLICLFWKQQQHMKLLFPNVYICFCVAFSFAIKAVCRLYGKPGQVTDSDEK